MPNQYEQDFSLAIPNMAYEAEYVRVINRWESCKEKIQPPSMRRYGPKESFSFSKWLAACEDDRTTGSLLENQIPCTFYFFVNGSNEILGGLDISHANTRRGQLHAGIVPWHRGKGYGTAMLSLAVKICTETGMNSIQIAPRKDNDGAIQTILRNNGVFLEEFYDGDILCVRFKISIQ